MVLVFPLQKGSIKPSTKKWLITDCWFCTKCHICNYFAYPICFSSLNGTGRGKKHSTRLLLPLHYSVVCLTKWGLKGVSSFRTPACRMDIRAVDIGPIIINTIPAIKMNLKYKKVRFRSGKFSIKSVYLSNLEKQHVLYTSHFQRTI